MGKALGREGGEKPRRRDGGGEGTGEGWVRGERKGEEALERER